MKHFLSRLIDSAHGDVEAYILLTCFGALALMALSAYHVVALQQPFEPSSFGEGLGCLLAGGGAAAWGQGLGRSNDKGSKQ